MMMTSLPRSVRTSSIHLDVWWNELASGGGVEGLVEGRVEGLEGLVEGQMERMAAGSSQRCKKHKLYGAVHHSNC